MINIYNMHTKFHSIVSYLIILLGIIHIYFVTCLNSFDTYALWFIGTGIAIIFAGFINLLRIKSVEKIVFKICILTNFIMMFLFFISLFILKEAQVIVGIILFGTSLYLSARKIKII